MALILVSMLSIGIVLAVGEPDRTRNVFYSTIFLLTITILWIWVQSSLIFYTRDINPAWTSAWMALNIERAPLSIQPAESYASLPSLALPVIIFLLGMLVARNDEDALRVLYVLALGSGGIATFGLYQYVLHPDTLIVLPKPAYLDSLTAVFINRNTAATFLGLSLILLVTFTLQSRAGLSRRRSERPALRKTISMVVTAIMSVFCFIALMLTQSRAGITCSLIAIAIYSPSLFGLYSRTSSFKNLRKSKGHARLSLAIWTCLAAALMFIFASRAIFRSEARSFSNDARFCVWPDILDVISDAWPYGTGFGTFRAAFAAYRDPSCRIGGIFDRAHSIYLEGALTLGMPFVLILAASLIGGGWVMYKGFISRRRKRHFIVMGGAASFIVLAHGAVDFSIQIPGLSIFYAAVMAPVITVSCKRASTQISA